MCFQLRDTSKGLHVPKRPDKFAPLGGVRLVVVQLVVVFFGSSDD